MRALTNENQEVAAACEADAFGALPAAQAATGQPIRFAGAPLAAGPALAHLLASSTARSFGPIRPAR